MAKIDKTHPDAKKNYNCNQRSYSSDRLANMKEHMLVHSATNLAHKLAPLKSTCEPILERSPLFAHSATSRAQ